MLVNYEGKPKENFWKYLLRPVKSDADTGQIAWACVRGIGVRGVLTDTRWCYRGERGEILARVWPDVSK